MKFLNKIIFPTLLIFSSYSQAGDEINDCVINGLKNVNSDVAARMIRQACESKVKNKINQSNNKKYGELMREELGITSWGRIEGMGVSVSFKNTTDKTITILKIEANSVFNNDKCSNGQPYIYYYSLVLMPGKELELMPPVKNLINKTINSMCLTVYSVAVREMTSKDYIYVLSKPEMMSSAQLKEIDNDMDTVFWSHSTYGPRDSIVVK